MSSEKQVLGDEDVEGGIHANTKDMYEDGRALDPVYQAKAHVLNDALQEIGMGRYQVHFPKNI
jgi:hypothetical protein